MAPSDIFELMKDISLSATVDAPNASPETILLAAILERAYRDLEPYTEWQHKRTAIAWFLGNGVRPKKEGPKAHFTFEEVKEELELSSTQVAYIMKKVKEAQLNMPKKRALITSINVIVAEYDIEAAHRLRLLKAACSRVRELQEELIN